MKIQRLDAQTVSLSGLNPLFCDLLREIITAADPGGSEAAHARLYSSPTSEVEVEFEEDWREYVEPDLREHFQSSLETVAGDLAKLPEKAGKKAAAITIPMAHVDGWVNALNQARLALHSSHDFSEHEMEGEPDLETPRGYAIFQTYFYGFLQECFIRELTRRG